METENKRYWLEYGIKLPVLVLIVCIIAFLVQTYIPDPSNDQWGTTVLLAASLPILVIMYFVAPHFPILGYQFLGVLFIILFYFIIGAIFGWLYGKYKNRKN